MENPRKTMKPKAQTKKLKKTLFSKKLLSAAYKKQASGVKIDIRQLERRKL